MKKINLKKTKTKAKIILLKLNNKMRKPSGWEGKVTIAEDFNVLPEYFMQYFK